uniref:30S ribosomal protein S21 n=1 Tax=Rhodosorus marinus TaxID=101924 RepID=A0A7S2ZBU8_9RHOD|mmetsp:Transcript_13836/g.55833  ORF Transcript_13836/g.55833 Transcript_13836/m.55833 type:complete len:114 (+) Transcript_13836:176-517(+)
MRMAFVGGFGVGSTRQSEFNGGNVCARSGFHGAQIVANAPAPRARVNMEVAVNLEDGENIEQALRRFKREVLRSGHLMEIRRRKNFETSTERRIRKEAMSKKRQRIARNARDR